MFSFHNNQFSSQAHTQAGAPLAPTRNIRRRLSVTFGPEPTDVERARALQAQFYGEQRLGAIRYDMRKSPEYWSNQLRPMLSQIPDGQVHTLAISAHGDEEGDLFQSEQECSFDAREVLQFMADLGLKATCIAFNCCEGSSYVTRFANEGQDILQRMGVSILTGIKGDLMAPEGYSPSGFTGQNGEVPAPFQDNFLSSFDLATRKRGRDVSLEPSVLQTNKRSRLV